MRGQLIVAFLAIVAAGVCACSGSAYNASVSGGLACAPASPRVAWGGDSKPAGLPAVAELDQLARAASAPPGQASDQAWMIEHSAGAQFVYHPGYGDENWRLIGNDEAAEWMIFAAGPEWSIGSVPEQFISMIASQEQDGMPGSWYAVADFAAGVWRWQAPIHPDAATNWEHYDMAGVLDPVSPSGYAYVAVAVFGAGNVAWPAEYCQFLYNVPVS